MGGKGEVSAKRVTKPAKEGTITLRTGSVLRPRLRPRRACRRFMSVRRSRKRGRGTHSCSQYARPPPWLWPFEPVERPSPQEDPKLLFEMSKRKIMGRKTKHARIVLVPEGAVARRDENVEWRQVVLVREREQQATRDDSGEVEADGVKRERGCRVEDLAHVRPGRGGEGLMARRFSIRSGRLESRKGTHSDDIRRSLADQVHAGREA